MKSAGNDIVALDKIDPGRSQHPGFYTKILAGPENALYHDHLFPFLSFEHFLWLLWSVKESVYKYAKRTSPGLVFSPTKIIIESIAALDDGEVADGSGSCLGDVAKGSGSNDRCEPGHGVAKGNGSCCGEPAESTGPCRRRGPFYTAQVRAGSALYYTKSFITEDCIFSMANNTNDFTGVTWGLHPIDNEGHEFQSKAVRGFLLERLHALFPDVIWAIEKSPEGYPVLLKDRRPCHHIPVSFAHHGCFVGYSLTL